MKTYRKHDIDMILYDLERIAWFLATLAVIGMFCYLAFFAHPMRII